MGKKDENDGLLESTVDAFEASTGEAPNDYELGEIKRLVKEYEEES